MEARELYSAVSWINHNMVATALARDYTKMVIALQKVSQGDQAAIASATAFRDRISVKTRDLDLLVLSDEQLRLLDRLGVRKFLGDMGQALLNEVFQEGKNAVARHAAAAELSSELQASLDRAEKIRQGLEGLLDEEVLDNDGVRIRVVFRADAEIKNLVDLKAWAAEWHDIGRGIAMASGASPEELRVVDAQKGSIILTLATTVVVARVAATLTLKCLEIVDKVLQLKRHAQEIESLRLNNEQLAQQIRRAAESERQDAESTVAAQTLEALGDDVDGEVAVALTRSAKKLISFVERGGSVDFVLRLSSKSELLDVAEAPERLRDLQGKVEKIRLLDADIKRLGYVPDAANEDVSEPDGQQSS